MDSLFFSKSFGADNEQDVAFWINDNFTENNFCELVRVAAGDIVEEVKLIDEFTHPKTAKTSHCYRITFRSMDRSLTDDEINVLYFKVRAISIERETPCMAIEC